MLRLSTLAISAATAATALAATMVISIAAPSEASANGRIPDGTGAESHQDFVLFPTTFGLLTSSDDGASFQWICEANVGYGGTYDPDYAVSADGDLWATTFEGLRVSRDAGCTWTSIGGDMEDLFFNDVEISPDGRVWAASGSGGVANDVFVSDDDGVTFQSGNLFDESIWWRSLRIAPSLATTIYVTGFQMAESDGNGGMTPPQAHLRKSINGGATWTVLPVTDFQFGSSPNLFILGVSATNPDIVFARVLGARDPAEDDIYRSADGGLTWTRVLQFQDFVESFVILDDDLTVIAGTRGNCPGDEADNMKGCVRRSTDLGLTWAAAGSEPKMGCLHERADGELLACGANWEPDNFALGRSTDKGQTWDKIVRFSEISGPLSCPQASPQFECSAKDWPALCIQLGICNSVDAGATGDDAGIGGDGGDGGGGGCGCNSTGAGLAVLLVLPLGWRRRPSRRRKR